MQQKKGINVMICALSSAIIVMPLVILFEIVLGNIVTAARNKVITCPIRHKIKHNAAYHTSTSVSSSTTLPAASQVVINLVSPAFLNSSTLTPKMVQQMINSYFFAFDS